ncbi:MAG: hypothetical protein K2W96_09070 [Gemmataceae bacterium]|nr:hypothetical protein [Gemmataceae bacterium]
MLARTLFIFLAFVALAANSGCRSWCERNYPCPQPGYAPYCPPAPGYAPVAPVAPVAPAAGFGPAPRTCTCTCP